MFPLFVFVPIKQAKNYHKALPCNIFTQKAPKKHIGDAFILRLNTMQI